MARFVIWALVFGLGVLAGVAGSAAVRGGGEEQPGRLTAEPLELPRGEQGPIIRNARQGDLDLSMVIYPGFAGRNDLNFYVVDTDRDWKEVLRFAARFKYLDGGQEAEYELPQLHEGHFPLEILALPLAGRWSVDITLIRAELGESRFTFEFTLLHQ